MLTRPEYHDVVRRLFKNKSDSKLSQAAMETLAIVAYRQPILRADIEAIRGVASGEMLRSLMDKNLVKIVGRAEVLGRPMLYGTTRRFLEVFGLNSLDDLPNVEALRGGRDAADQAKPAKGQETTRPSKTPKPTRRPKTADTGAGKGASKPKADDDERSSEGRKAAPEAGGVIGARSPSRTTRTKLPTTSTTNPTRRRKLL